MEKATPSAPGTDPQPPPYSEVDISQRSIPAASISQMHATYAPHPGHGGTSMAFVPAEAITQQPGSTVHIVTTSPLFGPNPIAMVCNVCGQRVISKITQQRSIRAHFCALSLCLLGCWPCVPCVYCTDCCMNVNHHCSNCNAYQGTFISTL